MAIVFMQHTICVQLVVQSLKYICKVIVERKLSLENRVLFAMTLDNSFQVFDLSAFWRIVLFYFLSRKSIN